MTRPTLTLPKRAKATGRDADPRRTLPFSPPPGSA